MSPPNAEQILAAWQAEFPDAPALLRTTFAEDFFLAVIHLARTQGVGYGWMRQAIGIAWKLEDPNGYFDDAKLLGLAMLRRAEERRAEEKT